MRIHGQLIRSRRRQLRLSIRELSKRFNILPAAMVRLEAVGHVGQISANTLGLVLKVLNLCLSDIDNEGRIRKATDGRVYRSSTPREITTFKFSGPERNLLESPPPSP
jgi:transcriptional regulator with XRE-family HTH domain